MYTAICGCDFRNEKDKQPNLFSEDETDGLLKKVFGGRITERLLPEQWYERIASYLFSGVEIGISQSEFNKPDRRAAPPVFVASLKENVYLFSGAKTYHEIKEVSGLLLKDGKRQAFKAFAEQAKGVLSTYNEAYLHTEYNYAIAQGRMASQWQYFEQNKEALPLLKYQTIGDGRVRKEHRAFDNIIRPVHDRFWDSHFPPLAWNCRCDVIALDEGEITDLNRVELPEVPAVFAFNSGKTGQIFSPKHPYFTEVPGKDRAFARENFGLPLPADKKE